MKFLADECVDSQIVHALRSDGQKVIYVVDFNKSISDDEVIQLANAENAILITEDKDFGELTFRLKFQHKGILLIRLSDLPRYERLILAIETISRHKNNMQNNFSVLTKNGLRIKTLKS